MRDFLRTHHYSKHEYMNSYVREWAAHFNNHTPGIPKIFKMFGICTQKHNALWRACREESVANNEKKLMKNLMKKRKKK